MLYERWRQTAAARPGELALRDGASGRCWTFAQLADEAERHAAPEGLVHPQGQGPEFIFTVLAAWREKRVVWPLEPAPSLPLITPPPRHCTHLKSTSGTAGSPRLAPYWPPPYRAYEIHAALRTSANVKLTPDAIAEPMAVPSSTAPILMRSRFCCSQS